MRFVRYRIDQEIRTGYFQTGYVVDLGAVLRHFAFEETSIQQVLDSPVEKLAVDPNLIPILQKLTEHNIQSLEQEEFIWMVDQVELLPPVSNPGKVLCVGLNYPTPPGADEFALPEYPIIFHKVASALTGHHHPIILPKISQAVDYEGELAVVIGKQAKQVSLEEASDYIAGYAIANDVGARDVQQRTTQWTSGKMFDTFCPLGPALVTVDEVPEPGNLSITTCLNEEVVQDSATNKMIFNVSYLVSYISELTTLLPGDIILTGSPKNVGDQPDPRKLMQPGDTISVEIENLGVLTNQIISEV